MKGGGARREDTERQKDAPATGEVLTDGHKPGKAPSAGPVHKRPAANDRATTVAKVGSPESNGTPHPSTSTQNRPTVPPRPLTQTV